MKIGLNLDKRFFGVLAMSLLVGSAAATPTVYAFANNNFGTLDLGTGNFTLISSPSTLLSGLGETSGGMICGGGYGTNIFYSVNPADGSLTAIGSSAINYFDTGSTTSGVFALDNALNLYSVNTSTGATTFIGATGQSFGGGYLGMSSGAGALYMSNGANVYSINTSTGSATLLGPSGVIGIGAMVSVSGTLYAGVENPLSIDTLDTTTGHGTFVANSNAPSIFFGMATVPVPEPISLAVLGLGAASLLRRRRAS